MSREHDELVIRRFGLAVVIAFGIATALPFGLAATVGGKDAARAVDHGTLARSSASAAKVQRAD